MSERTDAINARNAARWTAEKAKNQMYIDEKRKRDQMLADEERRMGYLQQGQQQGGGGGYTVGTLGVDMNAGAADAWVFNREGKPVKKFAGDFGNNLAQAKNQARAYIGSMPAQSSQQGGMFGSGTSTAASPQGIYSNTGQNAEASGSMASAGGMGAVSPQAAAAEKASYDLGASRLKSSYDDVARAKTNEMNRRGMFGSSVASEDMGGVNEAYAQGLAELAQRSKMGQYQTAGAGISNLAGMQSMDVQRQQMALLQRQQQQKELMSMLGMA